MFVLVSAGWFLQVLVILLMTVVISPGPDLAWGGPQLKSFLLLLGAAPRGCWKGRSCAFGIFFSWN